MRKSRIGAKLNNSVKLLQLGSDEAKVGPFLIKSL